MYQVLYRKYRPKTLDDVVGQKIIVQTLKNEIKNDQISHAYLFTGPRGTGKTSIAKILAKMVNCSDLKNFIPCDQCISCTEINNKQNTDIIEIDAASNNGVEEIRELKSKVNLVPSNGKYKIYIIDEVHMLTISAFNALLKTLEEPPEHIIFILATTDPQKIPLTILSRCQRFDFKKIAKNQIISGLKNIIDQENIKIDDNALELIANFSDGGMRDAISMLDQLTSFTDSVITVDDVHEINGTLTFKEMSNFLTSIISKDTKVIFSKITEYNSNGKNIYQITSEMLDFLKNVLIYDNCSNYFDDLEEVKCYDSIVQLVDSNFINQFVDILIHSLNDMKNSTNSFLLFELAIIKVLNINIYVENKNSNVQKEDMIVYNIHSNVKNETKEHKFVNNVIEQKNFIEQIKKIQDIRISNTLANFNKKDLVSFKDELFKLNTFITDSTIGSLVSIILDGELKAKGNNYLLFVYSTQSMADYFNSKLLEIEKLFFKVFEIPYKVIALESSKWESVKLQFNNSLKNHQNIFIYQEEPFDLKTIFHSNEVIENNKNEQENKNDVENLFGDIVKYN